MRCTRREFLKMAAGFAGLVSTNPWKILEFLQFTPTGKKKLAELPRLPGTEYLWLPFNGKRNVEEAIVAGTGVLEDQEIRKIKTNLWSFDYSKPGLVVCEYEIPEIYRHRETVVDFDTNSASYPKFQLHTVLNIPAFRWRIYLKGENDKDAQIADWPVVVGKVGRKSQVGSYELTHLEHYPSWVDPDTHEYVSPGPHNPLGIWKIFRPGMRWYYHGTNKEEILNSEQRARSRGCVRNKNWNIAKLAIVLLTRAVENPNALDIYDEKLNRRTCRKRVALSNPVIAKNVYDTIEFDERSQELVFYPNIYGYSKESSYVRLTNICHAEEEIEKYKSDIDYKKLERVVKRAQGISLPLRVKLSELYK
jgi:hypothetical protein